MRAWRNAFGCAEQDESGSPSQKNFERQEEVLAYRNLVQEVDGVLIAVRQGWLSTKSQSSLAKFMTLQSKLKAKKPSGKWSAQYEVSDFGVYAVKIASTIQATIARTKAKKELDAAVTTFYGPNARFDETLVVLKEEAPLLRMVRAM